MTHTENALGDFLRARRELTDPSEHGIVDAGRRRVHGLRREELAFLAGVSAPYYARLEQGRDRSPSPAVLDAIARVLFLDDEGLEHLLSLAQPALPRHRRPAGSAGPERVSPLVTQLIGSLHAQPALVIGRYRDVLASNDLAVALNLGFAGGRNLVRDTFFEPAVRALYVDWHDVAADAVAALRASVGHDLDDARLQALVGELSVKSPEFREIWARHDVRAKTSGVKRYGHPLFGELTLDYQTLALNGTAGQTLHVFAAAPGKAASERLRELERSLAIS